MVVKHYGNVEADNDRLSVMLEKGTVMELRGSDDYECRITWVKEKEIVVYTEWWSTGFRTVINRRPAATMCDVGFLDIQIRHADRRVLTRSGLEEARVHQVGRVKQGVYDGLSAGPWPG